MEKKKILLLTSYVTGHGHKSIANALEEELEFERFQTTACVILQEELEAIMNGKY